MTHGLEIRCPSCGKETLLLREPVYEGFSKVGERLSCSSCGHAFASEEEVPFAGHTQEQVFTEADRSAAVEVFEEHEADRLCRHCAHYVVNPFLQWCGVHKKEVEATDTCDRFESKSDPGASGEDSAPRPTF